MWRFENTAAYRQPLHWLTRVHFYPLRHIRDSGLLLLVSTSLFLSVHHYHHVTQLISLYRRLQQREVRVVGPRSYTAASPPQDTSHSVRGHEIPDGHIDLCPPPAKESNTEPPSVCNVDVGRMNATESNARPGRQDVPPGCVVSIPSDDMSVNPSDNVPVTLIVIIRQSLC